MLSKISNNEQRYNMEFVTSHDGLRKTSVCRTIDGTVIARCHQSSNCQTYNMHQLFCRVSVVTIVLSMSLNTQCNSMYLR